MAMTSGSSAQHFTKVQSHCYDAFFRGRPDMGVVAFGFGVLVAANRIRREAREAAAAQRTCSLEQLYAVVQGFREEVIVLGSITNQPAERTALFAVLASRLARAAVAEKSAWVSLATAFANFTALFATDLVDIIDELYAAALDPFDNVDEATKAACNVCDAVWAALDEAGYPNAPAQAPVRLATVCC